jgi:hypothetical protein
MARACYADKRHSQEFFVTGCALDMDQVQGSFRARLANILEVSSTIVPVVVLVLGIGMMRFMPSSPATPIFKSQDEAQAFFRDYNLAFKPEMPLLLSSNNCATCESVRASLLQDKVLFVEQNIDTNPGAGALFARVRKLTGDPTVPRVIVGRKVVSSNSTAIKLALKRITTGRE